MKKKKQKQNLVLLYFDSFVFQTDICDKKALLNNFLKHVIQNKKALSRPVKTLKKLKPLKLQLLVHCLFTSSLS